jgi:hypothetical protein
VPVRPTTRKPAAEPPTAPSALHPPALHACATTAAGSAKRRPRQHHVATHFVRLLLKVSLPVPAFDVETGKDSTSDQRWGYADDLPDAERW